jgi:membrane protein YdbS with pleckstrin-like domain
LTRTGIDGTGEESLRLGSKAAVYLTLRGFPLALFAGFWLALIIVASQQSRQSPSGVPFLMTDWAEGTAIFLALSWAYRILQVRSYRIELRDEGLVLDSGLLRLSHEVLLFNKIQDIVISRDIIARLLGLSTLIVQNAMGKPVRIPGIDAKSANLLRDAILGQIAR